MGIFYYRKILLKLSLYFTGNLDRWSECLGSNCPLCWTSSPRICCHKLESFNLADKLIWVTSKWTARYLDSSADSLWINDKCSTTCNSWFFIEDIVSCCNLSIVISKHQVWEILHQTLVLYPCSMREYSISRCCKNSHSEFIEFCLCICHILEFCRTHEGKISRIIEKYRPFSMKIVGWYISGIILDWVICWKLKTWGQSIDFYLFKKVFCITTRHSWKLIDYKYEFFKNSFPSI